MPTMSSNLLPVDRITAALDIMIAFRDALTLVTNLDTEEAKRTITSLSDAKKAMDESTEKARAQEAVVIKMRDGLATREAKVNAAEADVDSRLRELAQIEAETARAQSAVVTQQQDLKALANTLDARERTLIERDTAQRNEGVRVTEMAASIEAMRAELKQKLDKVKQIVGG